MKAVSMSNAELAKLNKKRSQPNLEEQFWSQLTIAGLTSLFQRGYPFAPEGETWAYRKKALYGPKARWQWFWETKPRKWKFDFYSERLRLAVEVDGSTFARAGRHTTGAGYAGDAAKLGHAAVLGICVIRADTNMIRDKVALDLIRRAIEARTDNDQPRIFRRGQMVTF